MRIEGIVEKQEIYWST